MKDSQLKIAVVLPCYKTSKQVLDVLTSIPETVTSIYCVDDACPEKTGEHIQSHCTDKRVTVLFHDQNLGVGGAMVTGYRQALAEKVDIVVKVDSDGQMDPALIPQFIAPIVNGQADYTKGNRFFTPQFLSGMPKVRLIGNAGIVFFE